MVSLDYENEIGDPVMGIDEAGRGPLAGGVYAAAVSVPLADAARLLDGAWRRVNDSKKLSPRARDELAEIIRSTSGCRWAVASASPAEIDELNILYATHLAMRRAADQVAAALGTDLESVKTESIQGRDLKSVNSRTCLKIGILVDGLPVSTLPFAKNIIKGDAKSLLIAAASILAKTARDADCLRLERLYPGYGFAKHKGYPTKDHIAALEKLGPCPEHRRSFRPVAEILRKK